MAQVVEPLPSKCKALSSNSSIEKKGNKNPLKGILEISIKFHTYNEANLIHIFKSVCLKNTMGNFIFCPALFSLMSPNNMIILY
jgi:hypothetical protein